MATTERKPQNILVVTRDAETLNFLFTALATPDPENPERQFKESPSRKDFAAVSLHDGQNYIFLTNNLNHAEEIIAACRLTEAFLAWNVRGNSAINTGGIILNLLEKSACPLYLIDGFGHLEQLQALLKKAKYRADYDGELWITPLDPERSQSRIPFTLLGKDPGAILGAIKKALGTEGPAPISSTESPDVSQEASRPARIRFVDLIRSWRRRLRTPRS